LVAAAYQHRTSREGDPQLHTHVLVANMVHAADGHWSSLASGACYQQARTCGFVYQAVLRAELGERLGLRFGPVVNGAAEIADVPKELTAEFSKRRAQVLARLEELGGSSRRTREIATLETRPRKDLAKTETMEGLRDRWRRECLEVGLDPAGADHLVGPARHVEVSSEAERSMRTQLLGPDGLTAQVSAFERRDAVRGFAERLRDGASLAVIEQLTDSLLADPEVVVLDGLGRAGEGLCTTRDMLRAESHLVEMGTTMSHLGAVVPEEVVAGVIADRPFMADEQVEMVRRLTTSGEGFQVVIGKAGAGKTYALDAARAAWQRAGYSVLGTALSARAAAELESGSGIPSCTLASFLSSENLHSLGRHHVVVVDEAGMVGTRQLEVLAGLLNWRHTPLVLVGDYRQLPEIEAGGALRLLGEKLGAVYLRENRRQVEGWERDALDELRHGNVSAAVLAYDDHGRLHLCDSARAARLQMVSDWAAARGDGAESRMYAIARGDVEELNRLARAELRLQGVIGEDVVTSDGRSFASNDEVLFCRNDRTLGVMNGTRGTVTGEADGHLSVETDKGTRLVPLDYLEAGHLRHGYASTIHKSQGATVDRAFVLGGDAMYREAGYVAMSRARERTDLYFTASSFDEAIGQERDDPLSRWLSTSRAKHLAIESLEPKRAEAEAVTIVSVAAEPHPESDGSLGRVDALKTHDAVAPGDDEGASERVVEGRVAASMAAGLLGEAAAQRTPDYLAEHLGTVPPAVSGRAAWVRVAGAAEALWRRLTGRSLQHPSAEHAAELARSEQVPIAVLELLDSRDRSLGGDREIGRGL
jgi:hypothetical protein